MGWRQKIVLCQISNLETAETKVTAETLLSQNDLLRKQLSLDRETQKTLTDSLVVSNAEAELFRRKYSDLQLRMEALGSRVGRAKTGRSSSSVF